MIIRRGMGWALTFAFSAPLAGWAQTTPHQRRDRREDVRDRREDHRDRREDWRDRRRSSTRRYEDGEG